MSKLRKALERLQLTCNATLVHGSDGDDMVQVENIGVQGKGQFTLLTPAEAIARTGLNEKVGPVEVPAEEVEPAEAGPTHVTALAKHGLSSYVATWLQTESWEHVEHIACDIDEGILQELVPDPGFIVDIVQALGRYDKGLVSPSILQAGKEAQAKLSKLIELELAAAAEARDSFMEEERTRIAEAAAVQPAEVDPGQFHGHEKAEREHQAAKASRVPVARFRSNGDSFYRVLETGSAAEVTQLKADIETRFDGRAKVVYATLQVRWEVDPALCI